MNLIILLLLSGSLGLVGTLLASISPILSLSLGYRKLISQDTTSFFVTRSYTL